MAMSAHDVLARVSQEKWTIAIAVCGFYAVYIALWARFFSPTAHIPGAWLDKICSLRLSVESLRGRRMYFIQGQLQRYGSLVEIAPNFLGCNDPAAIKVIYGSHDWRKSKFYKQFADLNSTPSLFSELRPERAQMLRRAFLPAFSRANIVAMSKHILGHLHLFLEKLEEYDAREEPMEVYRWTRYLTFQVVTDVGFGGEYDMISQGDAEPTFVRDFDDAVSFGFISVFLGPALKLWPRGLWPAKLRHWADAQNRTEAHARQGLDKWRVQKEAGQTGHRVDILQRLIDHGEKHPEETLSEHELIVEIMEIMLAGSDTTATTISYACYELTRFPEVQRKLRNALKQAIPSSTQDVKLEDIESCTYLEWTVKEMLRMHPTLPSALERIVPATGATIAGHRLKGGTLVAMSAHIQHQQASVFPSPEVFEPERWAKETPEMKLSSLAFSTGPRSCVGQNLAIVQMKIHMAMIMRNFEVTSHPSTTAESMAPKDFFQGKPTGGRCLLYFKKITD